MGVPDTGLPTPRLYVRDPVPSRSWYDPVLDAYLHTGSHALDLAEKFHHWNGQPVAIDIETPGLDRTFEINCLTASWEVDGQVHAILLDPARNNLHYNASSTLLTHAGALILHNAAFDTPPLFQSGLLSASHINKIVDTLLLARFAEPDTMVRKGLEACVARHLGMDDFDGGMTLAFKAAGYKTITAGYEGMDIGSPIYRVGAMADTVQTLRLESVLRAKAIAWTLDHPFVNHGAVEVSQAEKILHVQETVNRVMLRRSAVGLAVDTEYLTTYAEQIDQQRNVHIAELARHGLEGGMGKGAALVKYLDDRGELPAGWPRTRTGKLSSTKADLDSLDHPAAIAQRSLAETDKIMGYLEKVYRQADVTGRCHPQVGVLGASATGRMCIPTTHSLLTSRGVLKWSDVRIGDWTLDQHNHWVQVTGVHQYNDEDTIIRIGRNVRLEATHEHRWVTRSEFGKVRVEPIVGDQRKAIVLMPPSQGFDLRETRFHEDLPRRRSAQIAALIGLLVSDGRCAQHGNQLRAYIYQTEDKFYDEFIRVIPAQAVMYDRLTKSGIRHHEIRLKTRWLRPVLMDEGIDPGLLLGTSPDLLSWVLGLDEFECEAFLRAVYLADGVLSPSQGRRITCEHPETRDAVKMAAYRLGLRTYERITAPSEWGTKPRVELWFSDTDPWTRFMTAAPGCADVWCVTTTSGTFTAWNNGPYLTGNSYSSPELQQFPKAARAIITDDGHGLTSIDWSQIEPVTMALMAKDEVFLAPFEAGEDLYEPIQRSCGVNRDLAKVVLLATMYGQGVRSLAARIGHTEESAAQIRRQMIAAMPKCGKWMSQVQQISDQHGRIITAGGRILPVDPGFGYKAINFVVQGSAYDVLAHTICEMERLGIADELILAMHDEVVVSTPVAEQVQQIMITPPPFLTAWAGREPVLRTDRADMGTAWQKV